MFVGYLSPRTVRVSFDLLDTVPRGHRIRCHEAPVGSRHRTTQQEAGGEAALATQGSLFPAERPAPEPAAGPAPPAWRSYPGVGRWPGPGRHSGSFVGSSSGFGTLLTAQAFLRRSPRWFMPPLRPRPVSSAPRPDRFPLRLLGTADHRAVPDLSRRAGPGPPAQGAERSPGGGGVRAPRGPSPGPTRRAHGPALRREGRSKGPELTAEVLCCSRALLPAREPGALPPRSPSLPRVGQG